MILIIDAHEAFHVDEREAIRKNNVVLVGRVEAGVNEEPPGIDRHRIMEWEERLNRRYGLVTRYHGCCELRLVMVALWTNLVWH